MKHRTTLLLAPVVLALALLLGVLILCPATIRAEAATLSPALDVPVTITYWHHNTGDREAFTNQLIAEFNATNSHNITVVGEYAGNYGQIHTQVVDAIRTGGVLPNVVVAYPNSFTEFARYGQVRFLDAYVGDPVIGITDTADFDAGVLDYYRLLEYGNQMAGLQHGRSIEIMYYNADLLAGAGAAVPQTWDAFETACISVTNATVSGTIPGIDASRFATWIWSWGGELLTADWRRARFDEQPGIDSLALFQKLINGGYARLPQGSYEDMSAFGNGQTAFTFGSSAAIPYYRSAMAGGANQGWGVTRVPAISGHEVVDSYGAGQGILHHTEAEDRAAWLFIKWLAGTDQTARWAAMSGYFPVRISAATHVSMTQKLASDLQYAQAFGLLPLGRSEPGIRAYYAVRNIINGAMTDVLQNGANVTTTLQTAADEADVALAGSGPDSAAIPPAGGTLTYTNTQGLTVTVQFPPGALAVTETVTYVPLEDVPTDGLAFALAPNLTFSQPVTITIHYRDADIAGMDEAELRLWNYDWTAMAWVDADPCGGYARYPHDNVLEAGVCHFSDYAMMQWWYKVYLPVTLRAFSP